MRRLDVIVLRKGTEDSHGVGCKGPVCRGPNVKAWEGQVAAGQQVVL